MLKKCFIHYLWFWSYRFLGWSFRSTAMSECGCALVSYTSVVYVCSWCRLFCRLRRHASQHRWLISIMRWHRLCWKSGKTHTVFRSMSLHIETPSFCLVSICMKHSVSVETPSFCLVSICMKHFVSVGLKRFFTQRYFLQGYLSRACCPSI